MSNGLGKTILPKYFYDLNLMTDEGRPRWVDNFVPNNFIVMPPKTELMHMFGKAERNGAYSKWLASFSQTLPTGDIVPYLKPGQFKWQAIRILNAKHSETNKKDWWPNFQDAIFRVWLNPQTIYDEVTGEHKQWYLLSPEDGYLVNRYELEKTGVALNARDYDGYERYLSGDRRLRRARLIPVECCHHLKNEGEEIRGML